MTGVRAAGPRAGSLAPAQSPARGRSAAGERSAARGWSAAREDSRREDSRREGSRRRRARTHSPAREGGPGRPARAARDAEAPCPSQTCPIEPGSPGRSGHPSPPPGFDAIGSFASRQCRRVPRSTQVGHALGTALDAWPRDRLAAVPRPTAMHRPAASLHRQPGLCGRPSPQAPTVLHRRPGPTLEVSQ